MVEAGENNLDASLDKQWSALQKSQKSTTDFIALSQTKNTEGSDIRVYFNPKLVSCTAMTKQGCQPLLYC